MIDSSFNEKFDVTGTSDCPETHIYKDESGLMLRHLKFESGTECEEKKILVFTDLHLIELNELDKKENNPLVFKSYEKRREHFDTKRILGNVDRIMRLSSSFDKVIVAGDSLDFLTHGGLSLLKEHVLDVREDAIIIEGNHDTTRAAGHRDCDTTSIESRREILAKYVKNDLFYHKETLGGFLLICMNNCHRRYTEEQGKKLCSDIEFARENSLKILIFQHEMINTGNDAHKKLPALFVNSEWCYNAAYNFCDGADKIGISDEDAVTHSVYETITSNSDVIAGIICGHWHNDAYCEINAHYEKDGKRIDKPIPQFVVGSCAYGEGCAMIITLK